jgi:hypothetical protein
VYISLVYNSRHSPSPFSLYLSQGTRFSPYCKKPVRTSPDDHVYLAIYIANGLDDSAKLTAITRHSTVYIHLLPVKCMMMIPFIYVASEPATETTAARDLTEPHGTVSNRFFNSSEPPVHASDGFTPKLRCLNRDLVCRYVAAYQRPTRVSS